MTGRRSPEAKPDISILTPSYAYGRYLRVALDSAMRGTVNRVETIVQDACSPDETEEILHAAREMYGEAVKWKIEEDRGQSDALNKALPLASGRWVGWLNADEFYLPGGLDALISHGDRTGADVVYGDVLFVDEAGALSRLKPQHPFNDFILRNYGVFISSCATIFRREALWDKPWDAHLRLLMDQDMYLKLDHRGAKFSYLSYPAAAFRVHEERVSAETSAFAGDYAIVQGRHGRGGRASQWSAIALHALYKAVAGGYLRQLRAQRLKGRPMDWISNPEAKKHFEELLDECRYSRPVRA